MKVYPIGYSALGAREWLDELTKDPNVLIMDTRKTPYSWRVDYREQELRKKYGKQYHWCGAYLGNAGVHQGFIKIIDPDTGIRGLIQYLNEGHDLVILCECASPSVCHRSKVVELLLEKIDVEVIHPPKPGIETGMIRAFSTRPPYGTWLSNPQKFLEAGIIPKEIENRSTDFTGGYLGPVLIHQSKTFEQSAIQHWMVHAPSLGNGVLLDAFSSEKKDYPLGCIVGRAEIVKVVNEDDEDSLDTNDPWFCGPYGLVLKNAKPVDPPIPFKGQLGLFSIPESVLHAQNSVV
jgi:hypothetical protein